MNNYTLTIPKIKDITSFGTIIYETIIGDHVYGTNQDDSLVNLRGVYLANKMDVLGDKVCNIKIVTGNVLYYELSYFLKMLQKGEIEAIEMLFTEKPFVTKCDNRFDNIILKKKLYFVKNSIFGNNIIEKVKTDIDNVSISHENATTLFSETINKLDIEPTDFLYVLNETGLESLNFDYFYRKQQLKHIRLKDRYYTKEIKGFDSNTRKLMYSRDFNPELRGIINPTTGEFYNYNGSIHDSQQGIVYFDKKSYDFHYLKYIQNWNDTTDISSSDWILDSKENQIYYNSKKMMNCIRLLDMAIELYKSNTLNMDFTDLKDSLLNIVNGGLPFKDLIFDIYEKNSYLFNLLQKHTDQKQIPDAFITNILLQIRIYHYSKVIND